MTEDRFHKQMQAYDRWKSALAEAIREYQQWVDKYQPGSGEVELRLYEMTEALQADQLTVAVVAEFSRGKTELINAIFFANYGRRLLPSEAGRTTMCPTELFYDREADQAYIRLLPIETRQEDLSISELKRNPAYWTTLPLNINSADEMAETLLEVTRVKQVSLETAQRLGLHQENASGSGATPDRVEVPVWRHAIVSFPHPLLKQGLAILDTPGLNALGSEPELTLSMLPNAQAIIFLLAADTGVTRSDLDLWQHHIVGPRKAHPKGLLVALNKIDTLWDDLKDSTKIAQSIENQRRSSAEILGLEPASIFPISAQKALLAKIRNDRRLLESSGVLPLEAYLADEVLPEKERLLRESIAGQMDRLVNDSIEIVASQLQQIEQQLEELSGLSGKNTEVITHLMRKAREEQAAYLRNVENFQTSRKVLNQQCQTLLDNLSVDAFDKLLSETRKEMKESWTTSGMKQDMKAFFDAARRIMEEAALQAERTRRLIQTIYKRFHEEHGFPAITPRLFSLDAQLVQLEQLYHDGEEFRKSPVTTMTEQSFVVKKFFISLASHVRNLIYKANQEAQAWQKDVLNPLVVQIKEHKQMMEQRLETLRKISESRSTLESKISELQAQRAEVKTQLDTLRRIQETIQAPIPTAAPETRPALARTAM
ncbi:MAG: dynamin family protein [Gammaproteobacteria bacterium]